MNPQNIKDYVVNKILEKLNEQNEELESLRVENKKLRKAIDVHRHLCEKDIYNLHLVY